jgi:hypothetical protein
MSRVLTVLAFAGLVAGCKGDAPKPKHADQPAGDTAMGAMDRAEGGAASEGQPTTEPEAAEPAAPAADLPCELAPIASRYPAPERLVAIGDVHGDIAATRGALRLAGAIDENDNWIGGKLVVVQTGDLLDRGDDEQDILDMLERLIGEAAAAGGALHVLNGNHETMNAALDFGYVTEGGFRDFEDVPDLDTSHPAFEQIPAHAKARVAAFVPGGPYARLLSGHNTTIVVGDSVFAHGGVVPTYASYGLAKLNGEIRCWLSGDTPPPKLMDDGDNPMWSRHFSTEPEHCDLLRRSLDELGVSRMVVGHTPQMMGITSACDDNVWRIDVGMAKHYGGPLQVLEIVGDDVRILK